jgi:cytochrome c oxidase subunit 1
METTSTAIAGSTHATPGFWRQYVFSTDHKTIAKQYLGISAFMALVGGLLSYLIRSQLAWPEKPVAGWGFVGPDSYNAFVTMHGTIMVFFVAMPLLLGAMGNFLIPLMVGAGDMAFPRLNRLSVWTLFVASLVLLSSFFVSGGASPAGWTGYVPLSDVPKYTGAYWGINLWLIALALEFASFLMGGVNFLTTAINMRAPGMTFWRLPLIIWMQVTASVIFLLSVGPLIGGAIMLFLDRTLHTGFFVPGKGGDPLLWEHLFWFFGHPEVYVVALPGFGAMLEIFSVFSREPIFGYRTIVYSTIAAGVLSFVVWAHHMFVSGMDPRLAAPFSVTTILISVPFAIIVFAMIATLWGGSISFEVPMLFALGGLATFIVGGVTGIFLGSEAADIYFHGTYFVVAHFHYTLFPTVIFGGFAAIYYWYPKMFGRMMNDALGKVHFWLTMIFFNAVFIPLFLLGIGGAPRRVYTFEAYNFLRPLQPLNVIATYAAVALLLAQLPFLVNFVWSLARGKAAGRNPWRANTLEWTTDSPPPHGNFTTQPIVYRDPYEYSVPGETHDWLPQNQAEPPAVAVAAD